MFVISAVVVVRDSSDNNRSEVMHRAPCNKLALLLALDSIVVSSWYAAMLVPDNIQRLPLFIHQTRCRTFVSSAVLCAVCLPSAIRQSASLACEPHFHIAQHRALSTGCMHMTASRASQHPALATR